MLGGFIAGALAYTMENGDIRIEKIITNEIMSAMVLFCLYIPSHPLFYKVRKYYTYFLFDILHFDYKEDIVKNAFSILQMLLKYCNNLYFPEGKTKPEMLTYV